MIKIAYTEMTIFKRDNASKKFVSLLFISDVKRCHTLDGSSPAEVKILVLKPRSSTEDPGQNQCGRLEAFISLSSITLRLTPCELNTHNKSFN